MTAKGIYINVSRRNDDLPQLIEEYSEQFNLSKADTDAEIQSISKTYCLQAEGNGRRKQIIWEDVF